jgi:hypothetical protein
MARWKRKYLWSNHRVSSPPDHPNKVCLLRKAIYGLKQALYAWNLQFHGVLTGLGFMCMYSDAGVYMYHCQDDGGITIFIILYVNDITMLGNSGLEIDQIKLFLSSHYDMMDLGEIEFYLGVHITCDRSIKHLKINQSRYCTSPRITSQL